MVTKIAIILKRNYYIPPMSILNIVTLVIRIIKTMMVITFTPRMRVISTQNIYCIEIWKNG